jgi:hypothetical protein
MNQILRVSPSGPVVGLIGSGMVTRQVEGVTPITGTVRIPATLADGVVCTDGFGGAGEFNVQIDEPEIGKKYSAEVWFDCANQTTNIDAVVVVELQASVDDGGTWAKIASNQHQSSSNAESTEAARMMRLNMVPTPGSTLGVVAGATPTNSLMLRVRLGVPTVNGDVELYSPPTDGYGTAGLKGCFYMRLTETLA